MRTIYCLRNVLSSEGRIGVGAGGVGLLAWFMVHWICLSVKFSEGRQHTVYQRTSTCFCRLELHVIMIAYGMLTFSGVFMAIQYRWLFAVAFRILRNGSDNKVVSPVWSSMTWPLETRPLRRLHRLRPKRKKNVGTGIEAGRIRGELQQ